MVFDSEQRIIRPLSDDEVLTEALGSGLMAREAVTILLARCDRLQELVEQQGARIAKLEGLGWDPDEPVTEEREYEPPRCAYRSMTWEGHVDVGRSDDRDRG